MIKIDVKRTIKESFKNKDNIYLILNVLKNVVKALSFSLFSNLSIRKYGIPINININIPIKIRYIILSFL